MLVAPTTVAVEREKVRRGRMRRGVCIVGWLLWGFYGVYVVLFGCCFFAICRLASWWVVRCASVPRILLRSHRGGLEGLCHLEIPVMIVENSNISRVAVKLGYIARGS